MHADEPGGKEYRDLILRLLEGVRNDVGALREGQANTDQIARDAYNKLGELERRMGSVENESRDTTLSMVEIKAVAEGAGKVAGLIWGAVTGILGSIVVALIMHKLRLE